MYRVAASILVLSACGYALFFDRLGERDLWASHEARAAQNAQAMLDDGSWALPRLYDGSPELQKPPLFYWCVATVGWVRGGVDAIAVRLPATLAALATMLLVAAYLFRNGRPCAALVAAVALATAHHFTWIGRTGRIDLPLTLTTTVAVLCLRRATCWHVTALGYVAVVAGVLFKGPLGAILPGVVLVVDRLVERSPASLSGNRLECGGLTPLWIVPLGDPKRRQAAALLKPAILSGVLLVLTLTVPWFVYAHFATGGGFTRVFFWYHHFQRATGGAEALASHPWWFYLARWGVDWLPWSPLLAIAVWCFVRRPDLRADRDARFGFVWFASLTVFLSLSRFKRADYLLPAYPGAAILLGCWAERLPAVAVRRCATGALVACSIGWAVFLRTTVVDMDAEREKRTFAATVRSFAPVPQHVLFFRVEDHLLAFHVGRPVSGLLEWENLAVWVARPGWRCVVMPADCAAGWRSYISSGGLDELARWTDRTDRRRPRDLVLFRTRRDAPSRHDADPSRSPQALPRPAEPTASRPQPGGEAPGNG